MAKSKAAIEAEMWKQAFIALMANCGEVESCLPMDRYLDLDDHELMARRLAAGIGKRYNR